MTDNREKPTVIVSAFIEKDGKYLLTLDPKFGFWRVPGGRVEPNEKVEDTLVREMKEELNIEIKILEFLGFGQDVVFHKILSKDRSRVLLFFKCKIKKGQPTPMQEREISEIKWLGIDEIKNHSDLEPGMLDFFKRFNIS